MVAFNPEHTRTHRPSNPIEGVTIGVDRAANIVRVLKKYLEKRGFHPALRLTPEANTQIKVYCKNGQSEAVIIQERLIAPRTTEFKISVHGGGEKAEHLKNLVDTVMRKFYVNTNKALLKSAPYGTEAVFLLRARSA